MALSANISRITAGSPQTFRVPGTNANVFWAGAYIQIDRSTGFAVEAGDTANYVGFGVCTRKVTGDAANGDNEVEFIAGPFVLKEVNVTGVDNANDVGDPVYASADDTLTLSAGSNNKPIGLVARYYGSSTKADVAVYPFGMDTAL